MAHGRHTEIAGAGFAGLVAATALRQRGWTVTVHEESPTLRAFGAGIFIWENGLRVLNAIGAYQCVMKGSHEGVTYETRNANVLTSEFQFSSEQGTRMLTMTRQHLYSCIISAAERSGVVIKTNSKVVGATPNGVLLTADGGKHKADLVIGADGVRSKVRDSLGLLKERNSHSEGIIRVLAPRMKQELGPGNWDHVIDFWNIPRTPLRILYVPCNENDLYLAMMAPVADKIASGIPLAHDLWIDAFPQLEPVIRNVSVGGRYDAYETSKLIRWSSGRVAVIGDAAHAMAPTLGQGAGAAIMNALSLAVAVDQTEDLETALKDWEARERPLTEYTQDVSAQVAKERKVSLGQFWDPRSLKPARHIPTGTEHFPSLMAA
jgi:2-methyl-3-hydroxypyridine 5-carboxylic acid dioxygenase